jgi:hypothetical protein
MNTGSPLTPGSWKWSSSRGGPTPSSACLLLALSLGFLFQPAVPSAAQDNPPGASAAQTPQPEAGTQTPLAPLGTQTPDVVQQTLALDIRSATYYELLAWCRRIGLPDTGGRADLQQRLLSYYQVREEPPALTEGERSLQIQSAREADYFSIEEVDEQYVILRGGVRVELREKDTLHTILAEKIVFNQTEGILTAEGDVEYTMERGERTEHFRGESLTFNTETLEGVFFEGGTETEQSVEGRNIRFQFTGDSITRLENNTVILEDARITSSKPDDPYYHIRARKVWVLANGEWAVRSALLYVGRIPVVYLPFFFYPGDEFFFHPVIGHRPREGSFLQTTTYLIGQKPGRRTPLSILSLQEEEETQVRRRRAGLFLTEVPGQTVPRESLERYLKVLADVYSKLGAFAGVSGNFPPQISFIGGIGFSRSVFESGGTFSPFWPDPSSGTYRSFWNEARLFGAELPFRYGLEGAWQFDAGLFSISGKFEGYSDPFFPRDFFDRAEELDWSSLLGLEAESASQPPPTEKLNLTWEFNARTDLSKLLPSPLFQSASIPYFQARMFWQSRLLQGLTPDSPLSFDPSRRFYYPVSLQFPNTALTLSGEIFRYSSGEPKAAPARTGQPPSSAAPRGDTGPRAAGPPGEAAGTPATPAAGSAPEPGYRIPPALEEADGEAGREGAAAQAAERGGSAETERPAGGEPAPPGGGPAEGPPDGGTAPPEGPAPGEGPPAREDLPSAGEEFRLPEIQADLTAARERKGVLFRLGYQTRPDLIVEQIYDSAEWTAPEEIDYDTLYTTLKLTDTTSLGYDLNILENFLGLGGGLSVTGTYRERYRGTAPEDTAWQNLVLGDYRQTRADLATQFNLALHPLFGVRDFQRSAFSYNLNWVYYSWLYDEAESTYSRPVYRGSGPDWAAETVKNHRAQATLEYRPYDVSHTLSLIADLPPRPGTLSGRLQFTVWLLTTSVNTVLREDGGEWELQPLVVQETLTLGPDLRLTEELRFDLERSLFLRSTSALSFRGLSASLTAERLEPVEFNSTEGNWEPIAGQPERVQLSQLRLGYQLDAKPIYLWKNRIWAEPQIDTGWSIDLREFTENSLDFVFTLKFFIYRFLELSFTSASTNNQTYRYFPHLAEEIGQTPVNPFLDLLKSFNFFSPEDRRESAFKLRSISVQAVHHLHDWDLIVTYEGKPTLFSNSAGRLQYHWENTLILLLQWIPLPEVRSRVWLDSTGFFVRG